MRLIPLIALVLALMGPGTPVPSLAEAADCTFVLGFKDLHDVIPAILGDCVVDQRYSPQNGDGLQETTRGLLVWRKADNFTAFTDGYRTWVSGPFGIEQRLNTEHFHWEAVQQLRSAEYLLPLVDPQDRREKETPVRLANGEYSLVDPPLRIRATLLGDVVAVGDLDGDGVADGAAQLALNTGGSGTFLYLVAMVDRNTVLTQAGRAFLGDRVRVNRAGISDGIITLDMTVHGPNDPQCCPDQPETLRFKLEGDKLIGIEDVR